MVTTCNTASTNKIYILHIEDENAVAKAVARLLRKEFGNMVEISQADSWASLRFVVNEYPWSVIISDWDIAGMESGGDIYNIMQAHFPHLAKKYIFLSGNDKAEFLATAVGVPYLEKPTAGENIIAAVQQVLSQG